MLFFPSVMVLIVVVNRLSVNMELLRQKLGFVLRSNFILAVHRGYGRCRGYNRNLLP